MATATDRCPIEPRPSTDGRYVALDTENGETIIYDQEVETAWVQSDDAVELTASA